LNQLYKLYKKYYKGICILFVVLIAISFGAGETLKKIEIGEIAGIYNTIVAFVPQKILTVLEQIKLLIVVLWIVSLTLYFWKKRMNILCHTSLAYGVAPVSENIKKEYRIKKMDLDISKYSYPEKLGQVILEQDFIIEKFNDAKGIHGYYGIAHTPLIFRAGYMFGDQRECHLFHRKRSNDADFEEWDDSTSVSDWETSFKEVREENKTSKSDELIVAISTSFEIKDSEVESLSKPKCHVIKFQTQTLGFDVIGNYSQAELLRKQIMGKIREIVKKYDIKRIHMAISSSVAFTFFLGMAYSRQHDPEIIVYHYENGKYVWGLDVKRTGNEAIVIPTNTKQ